MVIEIELTRGKKALVDDIDNDLTQFNWSAHMAEPTLWYAYRGVYNPSNKQIKGHKMHRYILERILGRSLLKSEFTDHINGNGLDNRRDNIRLATRGQNTANRIKCKTGRNGAKPTSQFKGVSWHMWKGCGRWVAHIQTDHKRIRLGYFLNEIDAAKAYDAAALKHFKEFANINFDKEVQ
jgi:hypothetical protein